MSAEVNGTGPTFQVGTVKLFFDAKSKGQFQPANVTADGQRFLIGYAVGGQTTPPLTLVVNWEMALKKK